MQIRKLKANFGVHCPYPSSDAGTGTLLDGLGEALYRQSRFAEAMQAWW